MKLSRTYLTILLCAYFSSCTDATISKRTNSLQTYEATKPAIAKGNGLVEIHAGAAVSNNLSAKIRFSDDSEEVLAPLRSKSTIKIKIPEKAPAGPATGELFGEDTLITKFRFLVSGSNNESISTIAAEDLCSNVEFITPSGDKVNGKRVCKDAQYQTCNETQQIDCLSNKNFIAIDSARLIGENLKTGITIANVTGTFPSSSAQLTSDQSSRIGLIQTNLSSLIASTDAFEWWDAAGTRHEGTGSSELVSAKIKSGVTIYGVNGTYTGETTDSWNLRAGVSINGITGKAKSNCRNGTKLSTFDLSAAPQAVTVDSTLDTITLNSHGFSLNQKIYFIGSTLPSGIDDVTAYFVVSPTTNTFAISTSASGSAVNFSNTGTSVSVLPGGDNLGQIWDTISGIPDDSPNYPGWTSMNLCHGVETADGDTNVWKDVTTTGDGVTASTCAITGAHCSLKDKITGLHWSTAITGNWASTIAQCDAMVRNGFSDWRVPTEIELYDAYSHGIYSTADIANWHTTSDFVWQAFKAASHDYVYQGNIDIINLSSGIDGAHPLNTSYKSICVRP